jgi:TonB family protein
LIVQLARLHDQQEERDRQAALAAARAAQERQARESAAIRETGRRLEAEATPSRTVADPTRPEHLDSSMIKHAMADVEAQATACRESGGEVVVAVKVAPAGEVEAVEVVRAPDVALGECVRVTVQRTTFAATQRGGRFRYPFVVRRK